MCAFKLLPMYCASALVEKESPIRKLSDRLELVLQKWKNEREKCWNKPLQDAPLSPKLEIKERCRINPSKVARGGPVVKAKRGMQNLLEMLLARVAKSCFWLVPILFASNSLPACLRVKKPWNCQHGKKNCWAMSVHPENHCHHHWKTPKPTHLSKQSNLERALCSNPSLKQMF